MRATRQGSIGGFIDEEIKNNNNNRVAVACPRTPRWVIGGYICAVHR